MSQNMRAFFLGAVQKNGPVDYLILEDERYTFAQTYEAASRAASIFRDVFDIHKGDRVGIVMRNYPQVRIFPAFPFIDVVPEIFAFPSLSARLFLIFEFHSLPLHTTNDAKLGLC